jgi:sirohydrochlorin cobaltochelatase
MSNVTILVGHGAPPRDCPGELVSRLKRLEAERRRGGAPSVMNDEERALDRRIREWPRTPDNDPYREGVESLARRLAEALGGRVVTAYNEFCAPSLEDAVSSLVRQGVQSFTVVPTMLTQGGVHSELEIPEALAALREAHPDVAIVYAWPFDEARLAAVLAEHVMASRRDPRPRPPHG